MKFYVTINGITFECANKEDLIDELRDIIEEYESKKKSKFEIQIGD